MRVVSACLVLLIACAETHLRSDAGIVDAMGADGGAGDTPTEDDLRAFFDAVREARCEASIRCEHPRAQVIYCYPTPPTDYPWGLSGRAVDGADERYLFEAWRDGLMVFDPLAAQACLDAQATTCGVLNYVSGPCAEVFTGVRRLGEPCRGSLCVPGLFCAYSEDCSVEPTCMLESRRGESCLDSRCMEGLTCTESVCVDDPRPGDACGGGEWCGETLRCNDSLGSCEPLRAPGELCTNVTDCEADLFCHHDVIGGSGECTLGAVVGSACDDYDPPCAQYGRCVDGTCVRVVHLDEACDESVVCPLAFSCDGGRCAPLPMLGEACGAAGRCAHGVCDGTRCVPVAAPGATCPLPDDAPLGSCEHGPCSFAGSELGRCPTLSGLGERCEFAGDSVCASGLFCGGLDERCIELYPDSRC